MKAKLFISLLLLFTMLFSSCAKMYFANRNPKKWNDEYVDPYYIWNHRNSLAMGDTVMIWGWLVYVNDDYFHIVDDTSYLGLDYPDYKGHGTGIRYTTYYPWLDHDMEISFPEKPCKVYATGCFSYNTDCHCDWDYLFIPTKEEDIIFEVVNEN